MLEVEDEQKEEIEALRAIFEGDFVSVSLCPPSFMLKLTGLDLEMAGVLHLKVTFSQQYPHALPLIEFPMRQAILPPAIVKDLLDHLKHVAQDNLGTAMVFTLVEETKQWLNEHAAAGCHDDGSYEGEDSEDNLDDDVLDMRDCSLAVPKMTGGRWEYVIGLVGKPSAGKSTFFNAATTLDLAKTGSHPFTTIEPNFGKAFYSIPCPCARLCDKLCDAEYGHNFEGRRHIPILLKDVAGLIPGASEGKGLGNRFLNDLLDADVLLHIVDVSGHTNERGQQTEGHDPCLDVPWLQAEIQQWIFNNVMAKWDIIKRKPSKLIDMFTGYHANKSLIHSALVNAGVDPKDLSSLPKWPEEKVQKIVLEFLSLRFPMLLVLNKCDVAGAEENIRKLQDKFPQLPSIPVSAKKEVLLQKAQKSGSLQYEYGSSQFSLTESGQNHLTASEKSVLEDIRKTVIDRHGSTNVHKALCKAVSLRSPSYVFPVGCLESLKTANKHEREIHTLRDCISLKPETTVEEAYETLCHCPTNILSGEFVRAETTDGAGNRRQVRKDEIVQDSNNIIRFMTTKRVR